MRKILDEFSECFDQTDLVLAWLQIANRQDIRRRKLEFGSHDVERIVQMQGPKLRSGGERNHDNFFGIDSITSLDGGARKIAERQNFLGGANRASHTPAELTRTEARKKFRMFEKTDIMNTHYHRNRTPQRRSVLHVQQVRTVPAKLSGEIPTEARKRVSRYAPDFEARRNPGRRIVHR